MKKIWPFCAVFKWLQQDGGQKWSGTGMVGSSWNGLCIQKPDLSDSQIFTVERIFPFTTPLRVLHVWVYVNWTYKYTIQIVSQYPKVKCFGIQRQLEYQTKKSDNSMVKTRLRSKMNVLKNWQNGPVLEWLVPFYDKQSSIQIDPFDDSNLKRFWMSCVRILTVRIILVPSTVIIWILD
jgi:hypothetical protein